MRRYILLITTFLVAVSCSQMMVPELGGADRILCLNARLYTADSLHTVSACYGCRTGVEPAPGTVVTCYVNGVKADVAVADSLGDVILKVLIAPSDTVVVRAEAPLAPPVEAEAVAPSAPCLKRASIEIEDYYYVLMQMADYNAGEDYYVVKIYEDDIVYNQDSGEVVLLESTGSLSHGEQAQVFSDHGFDGAANTMKINFSASKRYSYMYRHYGSWDYEESVKQRFVQLTSIRLQLCSLCREDYWTSFLLSGGNYWEGFENPLDQIGGPKVYPCNVSGGAGLVAVRSCAEVSLPYAEVIEDGRGTVLSDRYLF